MSLFLSFIHFCSLWRGPRKPPQLALPLPVFPSANYSSEAQRRFWVHRLRLSGDLRIPGVPSCSGVRDSSPFQLSARAGGVTSAAPGARTRWQSGLADCRARAPVACAGAAVQYLRAQAEGRRSRAAVQAVPHRLSRELWRGWVLTSAGGARSALRHRARSQSRGYGQLEWL